MCFSILVKEEIVVKTEQLWDDESTWPEDDDNINESDGHMCPHCEDIFDTVLDMNKHLCAAFFCKHCNLSMTSKKAFNIHMMFQHCTYDSCQFCDITFQDKQELITHLETHTTIKFKLPTEIEKEKEKKNYCKFCDKSLSSKQIYELHMIKKHCFPNKCQFCEQKFNIKIKLIAHIATHTKLPYQLLNKCSKCNKQFMDDLQEINHKCPVDAKKTDKVEEKEIKVNANTEAATAKKLCLICNQKFFKQLGFETHMMDLHQMKKKCQFCGYSCRGRTGIVKHLVTHTTIKPKITCLQCSEFCVASAHECPKKRKILETQASSETESEKKRARKDVPDEAKDSSSSEEEKEEEEEEIETPIK
jgi:hypothetical protein